MKMKGCHSEYPIARGALIEPCKNRAVACAVRTTDLFMSSVAAPAAKSKDIAAAHNFAVDAALVVCTVTEEVT